MSYFGYVAAAYLVFATVLLWDFVVPKLQLRRQLRAVNLRAMREATRAANPSAPRPARPAESPPNRHPGESRDPF